MSRFKQAPFYLEALTLGLLPKSTEKRVGPQNGFKYVQMETNFGVVKLAFVQTGSRSSSIPSIYLQNPKKTKYNCWLHGRKKISFELHRGIRSYQGAAAIGHLLQALRSSQDQRLKRKLKAGAWGKPARGSFEEILFQFWASNFSPEGKGVLFSQEWGFQRLPHWPCHLPSPQLKADLSRGWGECPLGLCFSLLGGVTSFGWHFKGLPSCDRPYLP